MARGIGTSRKGRPVLSLQTLIDRVSKKKEASAVRLGEALDSAKVLDQDPRTRVARYRNAALTGGVLNPVVRGIGDAAKAVATAPRGKRIQAAATGFMGRNRGEVAKHVVEGALGGGGIKAVQEGLEVGQAKKKITKFLDAPAPKVAAKKPRASQAVQFVKAHMRSKKSDAEDREAVQQKSRQLESEIREHAPQAAHGGMLHTLSKLTMFARDGMDADAAKIERLESGKTAADRKFIAPAKSRIPMKPIDSPDFDFEVKSSALGAVNSAAKTVGRFSGMSTANALKAPGAAASTQAINPRRSIKSAINAFKTGI